MPKIRKQQKSKKYRTNLNRKRMRNKQRNTGKIISCKVIKENWNNWKSVNKNLKDMGLATDPNKAIKIPNYKLDQTKRAVAVVKQQFPLTVEQPMQNFQPRIKKEVVDILEKEAKIPRKRRFMLPKGQVEYLSYLLEKYDHDYKAMAKDKKNYYQETWKQIRQKIKRFMGVPKQYSEYLDGRALLTKDEDENVLKEQAKAFNMSDSE